MVSEFVAYLQVIHCLAKKKSHTNIPFALITERIYCGIVSTTLCNVTTFYFHPELH